MNIYRKHAIDEIIHYGKKAYTVVWALRTESSYYFRESILYKNFPQYLERLWRQIINSQAEVARLKEENSFLKTENDMIRPGLMELETQLAEWKKENTEIRINYDQLEQRMKNCQNCGNASANNCYDCKYDEQYPGNEDNWQLQEDTS